MGRGVCCWNWGRGGINRDSWGVVTERDKGVESVWENWRWMEEGCWIVGQERERCG